MYAIDFGNDRIPLKLIIYPGNQDTRIRIKDFFVEKQPIFKVAKNKFSNYYHSVYSTDIVSRSDFDKIDPEKDRSFTLLPDLEEIVKASWDKFVKIDYLKIEEYINSSRINE